MAAILIGPLRLIHPIAVGVILFREKVHWRIVKQ
jgi:hypothetical protein